MTARHLTEAVSDVVSTKVSARPHEEKIAEALKEVVFMGDSPVFDQPLIILAFVNRCGSNLLAEHLRQIPGIGGFQESLNWDTVTRQSSLLELESLQDYLSSIVSRRGGELGFGVKASGEQIAMLARWNIFAMFPAVKIIHIRREDLIAQAVSLHFALQTGQWTSQQSITQSGTDPIEYDFQSLLSKFDAIIKSNELIDRVCSASGFPRQTVIYEQLVSQPEKVLADLGSFLNLPPEFTLPKKETVLQKQTSPEKTEITNQFRADLAEWLF